MKYLKYSIIAGVFILVGGLFVYNSFFHGEMYMDRVFSYSEDGSDLFIGEMSRQEIFGCIYVHSYEFNFYMDGINKNESIGFISFSRNIEPSEHLISFSTEHNYETTTSGFSLTYEIQTGSYIKIDTNPLLANFVTKTDPEYFRYMSNGSGVLSIDGKEKNTHILSDTIISHDAVSAYLKEGTQVLGYMGGFWGTGGESGYFDISEIVERGKGETYEPHSYILSLSGEQESKKIYGLNIDEEGTDLILLHEDSPILRVDKNNIRKIGQGIRYDTYYIFTGKKGDGTSIGGFLNFVK
ncbi:hypothetical protein HOO68_00575 [Candidatus Gracilibacteria bacterium]|nr:hypothetical protein [Candidatus Gracilibacteria bacterium]